MPTSAARRESVLRQVREHIGRSSIEDPHELAETEAYVERLRTAAHNADDSGKIVALWVEQEREVHFEPCGRSTISRRNVPHDCPFSDLCCSGSIYTVASAGVKAKESDLVKEINPLIDEAREFAESSLPPNVAKTHLYKHEFDQKRRSARRHAASAAKEEAEMHARTGPLPPLPNYPYGGQHALAKARRSGGGYRAGLRYFGWHY
uniref:FGENESH: predicted gene_4.20 protein n=1 Tax=Rhodotorula toruloides TaxID=5286 RepID=A0A0K3CBY3_RHOTO